MKGSFINNHNLKTEKKKIIYKNNSLEIEYFFRPAGKETIIYIHGLGSFKEDFIGAVESGELKPYTLASFDFPGCGGSPYPENIILNIEDLVNITDLMLRELGLNKFAIIGHSMGGIVALMYAKKFKEKVTKFINVEGNLCHRNCGTAREAIKDGISSFEEKFFGKFKDEISKIENCGIKKYAETLKKHTSPKAFFDYCHTLVDYCDNFDLLKEMKELNLPRLYVYSEENASIFHYLKELEESGCEIKEISGSNHFPNYDNPKAYYRTINDFIKKT